jgi:hypothetical protein
MVEYRASQSRDFQLDEGCADPAHNRATSTDELTTSSQ